MYKVRTSMIVETLSEHTNRNTISRIEAEEYQMLALAAMRMIATLEAPMILIVTMARIATILLIPTHETNRNKGIE